MQAMTTFMLITSSIGFASGSYFLKRFADNNAAFDLMCAFTIFALANLAYARVLAHGLAQGAVLSSMAHIMVMVFIGVIAFDERLGLRQVAGVALAILVIWLFASAENSA